MTRNTSIIAAAILIFLVTAIHAGAEEPRFIKESFPGGFSLKEPVTFYDPGNLYEYINGQAVFYLSYRFTRLEHGFYVKGEATYYVDVYELGSRLSAFGSFRQQREEGAEAMNVGCEGSILDYLAVFYKGNFYIEIIPMNSTDNDRANMKLLAEQVEKLIPGSTDIPPEMALFPKDGLVPGSERYVDESLISYSFMGRGMVARYLPAGTDTEFRIFIALPDDEAQSQGIYKEYRQKLGDPAAVKIGSVAGVKGQEPYRGTTIIATVKNYVFGCLGAENESNVVGLLTEVSRNLQE